jgi:hypothetical protein
VRGSGQPLATWIGVQMVANDTDHLARVDLRPFFPPVRSRVLG